MVDTIFQWIDHVASLIGLLAGVVGFIKRERVAAWLRQRFQSNRFPAPDISFDELGPHVRGVVFTVSRPDVPEWIIRKLKPKAVGFVVTQQSRQAALPRLENLCKEEGIVSRVSQDVNTTHPQETQESAASLLRWLLGGQSLTPGELIVDLTGGTVPMSLGAFMAAEEMQVSSIYVTSDFDANLKQIVPGSQRPVIVSSPAERSAPA